MVLVAAVPLALAGTHTIVKGEKGPNASAVTWEFVPDSLGKWTGHITNNGLRWLVVEVSDNTSGTPLELMHQRIRFAAYNAFPSGEVDTNSVPMMAGHVYEITAVPNGPRGTSCVVDDVFAPAAFPVAVIAPPTVEGSMVTVDGSGSYDPDGTIVSYSWDWGDMTAPGSGAIATHVYSATGMYTITLTVTDGDGLTDSESVQVEITEVAKYPPVAVFAATMDWMTVSVNAGASYDPDGPIASYAWDFGDGSSGSGVTTAHTYTVEGTYTITLTVTDSDGLTGTASTDVVARAPHPPVASITWSQSSTSILTIDVSGAGSSDVDGSIVSYVWSWGDGSPGGMGMTASHKYAGKGPYTVTLTVTDNDGLTGSADVSVTLVDNPPVAFFTFTVSGTTVTVDASGSTDDFGIVSYAWDWGDGTTGTGMQASHTYANTPPGGSPTSAVVLKASHVVTAMGGGYDQPPPPPFNVFGQTLDSSGAVVPSCDITIQNLRTGDVVYTTSDADYGYYEYDLNKLPSGYLDGDIIKVTATKGSLSGSAEGALSKALGFLYLNVVLTGGAQPYDVTITLTVTDELGQSASYSQIVTIVPQ